MVDLYESKESEMRFTLYSLFSVVDNIYRFCREETAKFDKAKSKGEDWGYTYATGSGKILEITAEIRNREARTKYANLATLTLSDDNSELVLKINAHQGLMADPERLIESLKYHKKR